MDQGVEVGHISARMDAIFNEAGFDSFDRRYDKAQAEAAKRVTAKLDADYDPKGVDAYTAALVRAKGAAKLRDDFKARLGADFDVRAFREFERAMGTAKTEAANPVRAKLSADFDARGINAYNEALDKAEQRSKRRDAFAAHLGGDFDENAFRQFERTLDGIQDAATGAGGGIGGLRTNVGGLSGALGPVSAVLLPIAPLLLGVAGAATAVAGSLAAAAAGAGAVGVGFAAAAGPLAVLAGAVTQRVGLIGEAYKALGADQEKSAAQGAVAADTQRAAAEGVSSAEVSLQDAHRATLRAQENLTDARFRARRELDDLARSADRSATAEKGAQLALENSFKRLAEVETDPKATRLELRDAQQAVRAAEDGLKDARIERARANEDAKRGTDIVRKAREQLADTTRGEARAAAQVTAARAAATRETEKQGAAASAASTALAKLTGTERQVLEAFQRISKVARNTVAPATDAVFAGAARGLGRLTPAIGQYRKDLQDIGEEVGDVVDRAAKSLTGPEWTGALHEFADTAEDIVDPVANSFGSVLEILRDIAVAALPFVEEFANYVEDALGGFADKTGDAKRMDEVIEDLVDHTRSWGDFAGSAGKLIFALFNGGAKEGKSLVETMTDVLDRWTRFLNTKEGQERLRRFFKDSVNLASDLAEIAGEVGGAILGIFTAYSRANDAFEKFADAITIFLGTAAGATRQAFADTFDFVLGGLTGILGGVSSAATALGKLPGGGKFRGIAKDIDAARDSIDRYRKGLKDAGKDSDAVSMAKLRRENRDTGKAFKDMEKDGRASMTDVRRAVETNTKRIKERLGTDSKAGRDALADNFASAAKAVKKSMGRGVISTEDGMKEIRKLMVAEFIALGFTKKEATAAARGADGRAHTQDEPALQAIRGNARGGRLRRAVGGWLGAPGMVGPDSIERSAPQGSSVVNRHQLPFADLALHLDGAGGVDGLLSSGHGGGGGPMVQYVGAPGELELGPGATDRLDLAMRRQGLGNLDSLFASVTTPHHMARGGIVPVPGFPGEEAAASVISKIVATARKFGLTLTDAFDRDRSAGHSSPGHNVTGTAADFAGPDSGMDAAVAALVKAGYLVGYDGRFGSQRWAGHGPSSVAGGNAHLHVEFGGKGGAIGGASIARTAEKIRRVKAKGVHGALGSVVQGALDRARGATNDRISEVAQQQPVAGGQDSAGGGDGKPGSNPQVRSWLYQGLKLAGQPSTAANINTLYGRVMQESGGNPRAQNNWDINAKNGDPSKGLLQTIGATFRGYMVKGHGDIFNPVDNVAAAVRYMIARYGKLVGRSPTGAGYGSGGMIGTLPRFAGGGRIKAGNSAKSSTSIRGLRTLQSDRIENYESLVGQVTDLNQRYQLKEREYSLDVEELIDEDTGLVDEKAVREKANELASLGSIRQRIIEKYEMAKEVGERVRKSYTTILNRLRGSLRAAGKKDRPGVRATITSYEGRRDEWGNTLKELTNDLLPNARLDLRELTQERSAVLGTKASPVESGDPSTSSDLADGNSDTSSSSMEEARPPSAVEIATAAIAELSRFQASRENLFASFGSNYTMPGFGPDSSELGRAAGLRFYGAANDGRHVNGRPLGAGTTINNHFAAPPPDPHIWVQDQAHEVAARI